MGNHRRPRSDTTQDCRACETASAASTDSSSLFSAFFSERIVLTHFDEVRSRFVVLSMPNAVGKLPFRAAGDLFLV